MTLNASIGAVKIIDQIKNSRFNDFFQKGCYYGVNLNKDGHKTNKYIDNPNYSIYDGIHFNGEHLNKKNV